MNTNKILSLNFDTGAKYYGFYGVGIGANGLFNPITGEINKPLSSTFVVDKINSKVDERTTKRHARRNHDRKVFVARVFKELIPYIFNEDFKTRDKYNQTRILELFYGLFKHRGFNYINTPNVNNIDKKNQEKLSETIFSNAKTKQDLDDIISWKIDKALDDKDYDILQVLKEQKKLIVKANLQKQEDGFDSKQLQNYIDAVIKELENTNNKHRKRYQNDIKDLLNRFENIQGNVDKLNLKNIKKEFKTGFSEIKNLYYFLNISKDELYNIICNLSNLQTRVFRQYFNGKSNATYDDKKLYKAIKDNINYIPYKSDNELKNKKYMLELLGEKYQNGKALEFLKTCKPEKSITPYESLVNKQGQICNALMLKKEVLEQNNLENIFEIILNDEIFNGLKSDKEQKIEVLVQRYLDISKEYLPKGSLLYPRFLYLGKTALKQLKDELNEDKKSILNMIKNGFKQLGLNDKDYEILQKFAKEYYKEIELAKNGIVLNDKLSVCTCKTPHKTNMILQDLNALLGYEFFKDKNSVEEFKKHIKEQKIETVLAEINKIYQANSNSFWYKVEKTLSGQKVLLSDEELEKVQKYDDIFQKIIEDFKATNELYIRLQTNEIYGRLNFILQIYSILLKPRSGFANYCKEHSKEVMFRLNGSKVAMCQTLSKNSAREFNGGVEKLLDIVAYNVVEYLSNKGIEFSKFDEIHINTEQNKFLFEQELKDMVNTRKNSNNAKKDEENLICAYEGVGFVKEQGEYDHIIPRSSSHGEFNSEANLILVSSKGNQNKKDKYKTLDELNEKYLEDIYKEINSILASTSDKKSKEENVKIEQINKNNFKKFIKNNMPKISEYRSYHSLSRLEQIAFRHALFLDGVTGYKDVFDKALELLKISKVSSLVNGVQKRFVNLLHKKIKRKIIEKNLKSILNSDEFLDFLQKIKDFTKSSNHFPKNKREFILKIICDDEYLNELFTRPRKWSKSSKNHEFISEDIRNSLINLCSYIKNTYLKMDFETNSINSKAVSNFRSAIYGKYKNLDNCQSLKKEEIQSELSHSLDAGFVFYLTYEKLLKEANIDYINNIFSNNCDIVKITSKKYSELKFDNKNHSSSIDRVGLLKDSIYSFDFESLSLLDDLSPLVKIKIQTKYCNKFNPSSKKALEKQNLLLDNNQKEVEITSIFVKIQGEKKYIKEFEIESDNKKQPVYKTTDGYLISSERIYIDTNLMLDIYFAKFEELSSENICDDFFKNMKKYKLNTFIRKDIKDVLFKNNKRTLIEREVRIEDVLDDKDKLIDWFLFVYHNNSKNIYNTYNDKKTEKKSSKLIQELVKELGIEADNKMIKNYLLDKYHSKLKQYDDIFEVFKLQEEEFKEIISNKNYKKFNKLYSSKSIKDIKILFLRDMAKLQHKNDYDAIHEYLIKLDADEKLFKIQDIEAIIKDDKKLFDWFICVFKNKGSDIYNFFDNKETFVVKQILKQYDDIAEKDLEIEDYEKIRQFLWGKYLAKSFGKEYQNKDVFGLFTYDSVLFYDIVDNKLKLDKSIKPKIIEFYEINKNKTIDTIKRLFAENFIKEIILNEHELTEAYRNALMPKQQKNNNFMRKLREFKKFTYSVKVQSGNSCDMIVRRNNGFEGLGHDNIKALPYEIKESKDGEEKKIIVPISFYDKNVLPKNIDDIIQLIDFRKNRNGYNNKIQPIIINKNNLPKYNDYKGTYPFESVKLEYQDKSRTKVTVLINKSNSKKILIKMFNKYIDFNNINTTAKLSNVIGKTKLNIDFYLLSELLKIDDFKVGGFIFEGKKKDINNEIKKQCNGDKNLVEFAKIKTIRYKEIISLTNEFLELSFTASGSIEDFKNEFIC